MVYKNVNVTETKLFVEFRFKQKESRLTKLSDQF